MLLRAFQMGISFEDLNLLTVGEFMDVLTESSNDSYEYPNKATQEDINLLFGG